MEAPILMHTVQTLALLTPPETIEYLAILPGLIVGLVAFAVVLIDTLHTPGTTPGTAHDYLGYISAIGLGVAIFSCYMLWDDTLARPAFHGMIYLDKFSLLVAALCAGSGLLAVLMAPAYLRSHSMDRGELYMLILFSVSGMIFMANAADLLTVFLGLEVMSIPIYCLAGYLRRERTSAEAAMKYFILGAFSTGLLLYGIAMLYGLCGTTNLEMLGQKLDIITQTRAIDEPTQWMQMLAVLLVLSGFGFKIAAVPFHLWTPDVYTGSPTPVVGFMATAVKAAALAGMIRVFTIALWPEGLAGGFFGLGWLDIFMFLAAASIVLGNLVAIVQDNVKRMLAYSSIAHAGYILVGFLAANASGSYFLYNDTVIFYLIAYTFGTIGAFGVLTYFGRRNETVETYEDLAGLGFKYPMAGLVMGVCMFSSAGIPPTAGFIGKLYVFRAAVDVGIRSNEAAIAAQQQLGITEPTSELSLIGLTILAVLFSVAGIYYYLKVLVYMYMEKQQREIRALEHSSLKFALVVCAVLTLYLGIFPGQAVQLSREALVDFKGTPPSVQAVQQRGAEELEVLERRQRLAEAGMLDQGAEGEEAAAEGEAREQ